MNHVVSLLVPSGQAAPGTTEPKFPAATARSRAAAPFSSVLERAEYRAPERNQRNAKSTRPVSAHTKASPDESLTAERRPPVRAKQKQDKPSDDHSLAGACAVNGQPVKPEESTSPAEVIAGSETETTPISAPDAATASREDGEPTTSGALTAEGEGAGETGFPVTTAATTEAAEDLKSLLTPTSSTEATATATAANSPAIPTGSTIAAALAEVETQPAPSDVVADAKPAASATSARAAEVLLATTAGDETVLNAETAAALIPDVVSAAGASEEARQAARAARRFRAETLENAGGIGGAKIIATMKTAIKKEDIAGGAQQLLPGSSVGAAAALPSLPGELRRSSSESISPAEAMGLAGKLAPAPARADVAGTGNAAELRASSPLLRVSELISREVRMFKRGGDDLVEVVLTPDARTQISLRLQWREGQVEVQARCDLGDYRSLNTQWPQLQASLASHGVRLSHLSERTPTGFTEFFSNPNFAQHQGRDRQPDAPARAPESLRGAAAPATPSGAAAAPRRSTRLFDSWA